MHPLSLFAVAVLAPVTGFAAPVEHSGAVSRGENLCSLPSPPEICQPDPSVTVEETAQRAYDFYRAFVVDGDPRKMFSLIDEVYQVSPTLQSSPPPPPPFSPPFPQDWRNGNTEQ